MNKESKIDRIREHQANERTFLAWLRTSIALIGFGFAIARFGIFIRQLQTTLTQQQVETNPFFSSENLGVSLVIFGIVLIALAAWRYNRVFREIERGEYRPNTLIVWIITAVVMILGTLSIPLLLLRNKLPTSPTSSPSQPESKHFFKRKFSSRIPKAKGKKQKIKFYLRSFIPKTNRIADFIKPGNK
jgi:putative membrane protein